MDKKIVIQIIQDLLDHLPDSNHYEDCWLWCWGELNNKCQNDVKSVREKAQKQLMILLEEVGSHIYTKDCWCKPEPFCPNN